MLKLIVVLTFCLMGRAYENPSMRRRTRIPDRILNKNQKILSSSHTEIPHNSQLQALPCRAWMWKKEKKIKSFPLTDPPHIVSKLVNKNTLYLTETEKENHKSVISIVDFLESGEIVFRASEIPNLRFARGSWTCDPTGIILKMVIDRIYSDGNEAKSHYLGVMSKIDDGNKEKNNDEKAKYGGGETDKYDEDGEDKNDEDRLCIGGEVCDEMCDIDDDGMKKQFELSRAGAVYLVSKEKKFEDNFV